MNSVLDKAADHEGADHEGAGHQGVRKLLFELEVFKKGATRVEAIVTGADVGRVQLLAATT